MLLYLKTTEDSSLGSCKYFTFISFLAEILCSSTLSQYLTPVRIEQNSGTSCLLYGLSGTRPSLAELFCSLLSACSAYLVHLHHVHSRIMEQVALLLGFLEQDSLLLSSFALYFQYLTLGVIRVVTNLMLIAWELRKLSTELTPVIVNSFTPLCLWNKSLSCCALQNKTHS